MRITKVKVKNNYVEINRKQSGASLEVGGIEYKTIKEIQGFLEENKKESLISSILNTTFKKEKDFKDNRVKYNKYKQILKTILDNSFDDKYYNNNSETKIDIGSLRLFLKEKIIVQLNQFKKKQSNSKDKSIDILEDNKKTPNNILKIYNDWARIFFKHKIKKISESISKNTTSINDSPRGKVLKYFKDNDTSGNFKAPNDFDEFIKNINKEFKDFKLPNESSNNTNKKTNIFFELNSKIRECYKDYFWKFIRDNKDKLKESGVNQEHITRQYIIEVGKYLDLYFPVKKSGKKQDEEHCEYYLKKETIKNIIEERFKNALNLYQLKDGQEPNSEELIFKKIQQAFMSKFLTACGFAGNNLKLIVNENNNNEKLQSDALGKKDLTAYFKNLTSTDKTNIENKLKAFFNIDEISPIIKDIETIIFATRESVSNIRNYLHHQEENKQFLDLENKQIATIEILSPLFGFEINKIPDLITEKIKTAGLTDYYNEKELGIILSAYSFVPKPISFAQGFKKTFQIGTKYQIKADNHLKTIIYNKYDLYTNDKNEKQRQQAHYNALMYIYNQVFIHEFLKESNKKTFYEIKKLIIEANKEQNKEQKNNNKFAFKEIEEFKEETLPPVEYLRQIQSFLLKEESLKRSKDGAEEKTLAEDETGNYQKFIEQLFVKGFDNFIEQNSQYDFLKKAKETNSSEKINEENLNKIIAGKLTKDFDESDNSTLAFWIFCKMLDSKNLNELTNQISKFMQALEKNNTLTTNHKELKNRFDNCQKVISLCLLTNDKILLDNTTLPKEAIKPYVADDIILNTLLEEKYTQSDKETPIIFAHLENMKKYTTSHIIQGVIEKSSNAKITEKDFNDFIKIKSEIQNNVLNREDLHKKWSDAKNKNKWVYSDIKKKILSNEVESYKNLCEKISEFDWLNNKIHFVHIKRLHDLLMDILGRFAGYATMFEKNKETLKSLNKLTPDKKNNGKLAYREIEIRNFLAHFNYIKSKDLPEYSILDLMEQIREMVSYDRKLKNSVTKSLVTILDRHGIEITFKELHSNGHKFKIQEIKSKNINHLGGKIKISQHNKEYIDIVKNLLELKK